MHFCDRCRSPRATQLGWHSLDAALMLATKGVLSRHGVPCCSWKPWPKQPRRTWRGTGRRVLTSPQSAPLRTSRRRCGGAATATRSAPRSWRAATRGMHFYPCTPTWILQHCMDMQLGGRAACPTRLSKALCADLAHTELFEAFAEQRRRCKKQRLRVSSPDSRAMVTRMLAAAGRPHAATARATGAMTRCCWLSHTSYTA